MDLEDDGLIIICRDIPGDHLGGPECWCNPVAVRVEDDETFNRLMEDPSWNRAN